jgi:hypothetical protein
LSNELSDTRVLRGPEAAQALDCYAQQLENQKGDDLTSKQIDFLVKTARILGQIMSTTQDSCVNAIQNNPPYNTEKTAKETREK